MPSYLHPGVYVEEIPSGSKPIEGVGTSTAAFIGYATKGPIGEPELIYKWDDYDKQFGGIRDTKKAKGDPMGFSIRAFFQNGGTAAYIVRITKDWNKSNASAENKGGKAVAYLDNPAVSGAAAGTDNALKFSAVNEGSWANGMVVRMSVSAIDASLYDVEIGWRNDDGDFSADERFSNVSMDESEAQFIGNVINDVSELVTVEFADVSTKEISSDDYRGTSTSEDLGTSFSLDLSGADYTDPRSRQLAISIDGTPFTMELPAVRYASLSAVAEAIESEVTSGTTAVRRTAFTCRVDKDGRRLVLTSGTRKSSSSVEVTEVAGLAAALKLGVGHTAICTGGDLEATFPLNVSGDPAGRTLTVTLDGSGTPQSVVIAENTYDLSKLPDLASQIEAGLAGVICYAKEKRLVLVSAEYGANANIAIDSSGIAAALKFSPSDTTPQVISIGGVELTGQETVDVASASNSEDAFEGGDDGKEPASGDYDPVFTKFLKYRDINIICLPGQNWPKDKGTDVEGQPVIDAAIAHAVRMKSRMVIVDPPASEELENPVDVVGLSLPNKTYSVFYYPWVKVANPFYNAETNPGASRTVLVPPSGFAAGMWAKIDGKRGVWKAPAGLETGLLGVAKLEYVVEDNEQDSLNPWGVNCLRNMPGGGPVIWGARTLATKADPEWRYVPVRRTAIMIEQSIYNGIQWAVFEPNDHRLWSALRANIGNFMNGLFRAGAFQGEKASDAYFVRCGLGDTMTQGDIDAGQVIAIVGFAPLKPAEFVIVRIQQKVNQQ